MLLPRRSDGTAEAADGDPRRELVERLLEHQRFKNAAQMLLQKQMLEESSWTNPAIRQFLDDAGSEPEIAADTGRLGPGVEEMLDRARQRPVLNVDEESVTVAQMIDYVRRRLVMEDRPVALRRLLQHVQSKSRRLFAPSSVCWSWFGCRRYYCVKRAASGNLYTKKTTISSPP